MLRSATVLAVAACVLGVVCLPGVSEGEQENQLVGRTATGTLEGDKGTNQIRLQFLSGGRVRVGQTAEDGKEYVGTWSLDGNRISMRIGPSSFSGTLEGNRITGSRSRDDGIRDSWKATLSGVDPTDEEGVLLGAEVEAPPDIPLPLPRLAKPIPRSAVERCIADE